ncbi:hypothetical protein OsJ_00790 [Oryza sativa Japonica Group]|uniref:Uncharacterized protein n=1 Tax=Oryza sativa subsp. japonica TaxID=39947 RepID=B9ETZ4_ORYSJ|nr:hypothetical protein OsJ_00790 [Oryza sativa Japonica Group]
MAVVAPTGEQRHQPRRAAGEAMASPQRVVTSASSGGGRGDGVGTGGDDPDVQRPWPWQAAVHFSARRQRTNSGDGAPRVDPVAGGSLRPSLLPPAAVVASAAATDGRRGSGRRWMAWRRPTAAVAVAEGRGGNGRGRIRRKSLRRLSSPTKSSGGVGGGRRWMAW